MMGRLTDSKIAKAASKVKLDLRHDNSMHISAFQADLHKMEPMAIFPQAVWRGSN
jgi:hypothetical protein